MELSDLRIFRTVVAEGGVTRAAEKLLRVQSSITTRVRQLEEGLGVDLFIREGKRMHVSPAGKILLDYADKLLALAEEAREATHGTVPRGGFRIGAMESTAAGRLPEILARYQDLHPDVHIELETGTAGSLMERLFSYDVEAVLVAEPVMFEQVSTLRVFEEDLVLIAPRSFPELKNVEEISGKTVIAFEEGCAYRRYLEDWLLETGIVPGKIMSVSSYLAIFACVAAGTGYAVAPQCVLDRVPTTEEQFRQYPLPGKMSRIKTMLAWRTGHGSAKLEALKELLPGSG